jgi:protein SCO1/2
MSPATPTPHTDRKRRHSRLSTWALAASLIAAPMGQAAAGITTPPMAPKADQFARNFDGTVLTDVQGLRFDPQALSGQVVLYNFFFTGCSTVCPTQTAALSRVLAGLSPAARRRVHIVSVSIDPLSDTPTTLKAYARRMGADRPGWHFVSGRPNDITQVSDRLKLMPRGAHTRPATHTTALWLVDAAGHLRMRYDGRQPDVHRLTRELDILATQPAPISPPS